MRSTPAGVAKPTGPATSCTVAPASLAAAAIVPPAACADDTASTPSGSTGGGAEGELIVLGFSQVGAESGWRAANTKSIQDTLTKENGFDLKFSDAQQKQENQIQALRSYISQGVDILAFSPVVETGWDAVLQEAKDAGIPVVLTDRAIDSDDDSLYATFIGSDFVKEGEMAGEWAKEQYDGQGLTVVELQGTTGSAPANDRKTGFASAIEGSDHEINDSQTGNFTRTEGKTVMEGFLQKHDKIDIVYAHNDDMGLGAIEAIEAAGKVPGQDIKIITIDAVKDGMQALVDGKINYIVECNPLLGPDLADIAKKVLAGEEVEKRIVVKDEAFDQEAAKAVIADRQY